MIGDVQKARKGNVRAFERLMNSHKVVMYRVAKTILHSDADCADAMQESMLKAFENLKSLREPAYFKTWLLRIVINECNRIHRHNKKVVEITERMAPAADEGFAKVEIEQLLMTLPQEDRDLLKLYHIEDISIKDLADLYRAPENTIKTWLRRAREKARRIWEEQEVYEWKNGSGN